MSRHFIINEHEELCSRGFLCKQHHQVFYVNCEFILLTQPNCFGLAHYKNQRAELYNSIIRASYGNDTMSKIMVLENEVDNMYWDEFKKHNINYNRYIKMVANKVLFEHGMLFYPHNKPVSLGFYSKSHLKRIADNNEEYYKSYENIKKIINNTDGAKGCLNDLNHLVYANRLPTASKIELISGINTLIEQIKKDIK